MRNAQTVAAVAVLLLSILSPQANVAQEQHQNEVKAGSTVFIEDMDGFGDYVAAAFHAKRVPLVIVTDKAKADYIVTGSCRSRGPKRRGSDQSYRQDGRGCLRVRLRPRLHDPRQAECGRSVRQEFEEGYRSVTMMQTANGSSLWPLVLWVCPIPSKCYRS